MSAFYVSEGCMDAALTFLHSKANVAPLASPELTNLGRAMLLLNEVALEARYGDAVSDAWRKYDWRQPDPYTDVIGLKSLRCWLYQCCEGNIPETSALYQRVQALADQWDALSETPEYDAAEWGGPMRKDQ